MSKITESGFAPGESRSSLDTSVSDSQSSAPSSAPSSRPSTPLTIPSLESSLCDFVQTDLASLETDGSLDAALKLYTIEDLRDGHADRHGVDKPQAGSLLQLPPLELAPALERVPEPSFLPQPTVHAPTAFLNLKSEESQSGDDDDDTASLASFHTAADDDEIGSEASFVTVSEGEIETFEEPALLRASTPELQGMPGAWSDAYAQPELETPGIPGQLQNETIKNGEKASSDGGLPHAASVSEKSPLDHKAADAIGADMVEGAAHLTANKRVIALDPLVEGTHKLQGMGWESMMRSLKTIDVTVAPDTRINVELQLQQRAAQSSSSKGLVGLCLGAVTGWCAAGWRMVTGQPSVGAGLAARLGAQAGASLAAEQVDIAFTQPIVARPQGWYTNLFRVELNGVQLNGEGALVPRGRVKLLNFLSIGIGWTSRFLPKFNMDVDTIAQKGLMIGDPASTPEEVAAANLKNAGVMNFVRSVLPQNFRINALGQHASEAPATFFLPLERLGAQGQLKVVTTPRDNTWSVGLQQAEKGERAKVSVASTSKLQVFGPQAGSAELKIEMQAAAHIADPLIPPPVVPASAQKAQDAVSLAPVDRVRGWLDQLGDTQIVGNLDASVSIGAKLPGESEFSPWMEGLSLNRQDLPEKGVVQWSTQSGMRDAPRTRALLDALHLDLPVLDLLSERVVRSDHQFFVARR